MAALRRGIAHYAAGEPDTGAATSFAPGVQATPATAQAPQMLPAQSGSGQLFSGQATAAAQNPESSPATAAIAGFFAHQDLMRRASALATPPSVMEQVANFFAGRQGDTSLSDRAAAAAALGHPLAQQRFMDNPGELAKAEKDPAGYAQDPDFKQYMQNAAAIHAAAHDPGGIVHPDGSIKLPENPAAVARAAITTGATLPQALAGTAPHQYTEDEFVKTVSKMPVKVAEMLFGAQLAHVATPQETLTHKYFGALEDDLNEAKKKRQALEADPAASQAPFWGTSRLAAAQAEEAKRRQIIMNALAPIVGAAAKLYEVPPQQ
jgi:hypothetical protein